MKNKYLLLLLFFKISISQNFPGGVVDSNVWHYPDFSSETAINYSNSSSFYVSSSLEYQERLFNFNESYFSSDQLNFISQLMNEVSSGKDFFIVAEYIGSGEELSYSLGSTSWTKLYLDLDTGFVQKNDLGLSTKYAEIYKDGVPLDIGQSTINNFHWNNYAKSRIYNTFGYNGETLFDIGTNFLFNNSNLLVENFKGYIPEFIIFPYEVSKNQQNRIESYLAIKYGITINSSYKNSTNILIWNEGGNFNENIFGLGRDEVSGLNQLIAESRNYQNDLIASIGTIAETNKIKQEETNIDDNHFILFGNNDSTLNLNEQNELFFRTMQRVWLAHVTGELSSTYDVHFKVKQPPAVTEYLASEEGLKFWLLRDPHAENQNISDFLSDYVQYYEPSSMEEDYSIFQGVNFDADENIYDQFTFAVGPEMVVQVRFDDVPCDEIDKFYNATIVITGGRPKYSVLVEKEGEPYFETLTSSNEIPLDNLYQGTYSVKVTDSNGLTVVNTFEVELYQNDLNLGPSQNLSFSQPEITLDASLLINDPNPAYEWYKDGELLENHEGQLVVDEPGTYSTIVYVNNRQCYLEDTIEITNFLDAILDYEIVCDDETPNFTITVQGGTPNYNIQIFDDNNNQIGTAAVLNQQNNVLSISNLDYGNYMFQVTDQNGQVENLQYAFEDPYDGFDLDLSSLLDLSDCSPASNYIGYEVFCYSATSPINLDQVDFDASLGIDSGVNVIYEWYYQCVHGGTYETYGELNFITNLNTLTLYHNEGSLIDCDNDPVTNDGIFKYSVVVTNTDNGCTLEYDFVARSYYPFQAEDIQNIPNNNEQNIIEDFSVVTKTYPNPAYPNQNVIHEVLLSESKDVKTKVVDILGREIYYTESKNKLRHQIPIQLIASGVYFIVSEIENTIITDKIIIE